MLEAIDILQQKLNHAGILSADYDFEAHKELVPLQLDKVSVTCVDTTVLERNLGFKLRKVYGRSYSGIKRVICKYINERAVLQMECGE